MIIGQLWLVLATYEEVVLPALLAAFVVTVLLFRVALFVRDRRILPKHPMAASYESPTEYIQHHLTFLTKPVGDGRFLDDQCRHDRHVDRRSAC